MAHDDSHTTVTVSEPDRFDYTSWAFDYREELRDALVEAGASEYLLQFVDTVEPGTRHSVLMTLFRHHDGAPSVEGCEEAYQLGGGFFTKLWDGHVADAYCHADGNNRPMMEDTFEKEEIINAGLANDGPFRDREYLTKLVSEKWTSSP